MNSKTTNQTSPQYIEAKLFKNNQESDKIILIMIFAHWFAASTIMGIAYNTYLFGFLNGGVIAILSLLFYKLYRGTALSRIFFGIALLAFSAIFIQQHLGRIEMHFHIFVAIAFLTIYKDSLAALSASLFIGTHHVIANILQDNVSVILDIPVYIFNYGCGLDIVAIHAAFVLVEFTVVSYFISISRKRFIQVVASEFRYKELSKNLEREVQSRTSQYLSAKEDAESATRAKSSFLANMSHEIRTPLNAILGFVQILKEDETDKEKSKYIDTIKKSSDSLLEIINDILDFAKVESGKMVLDPILVNPHEDFDNIASLFFAKGEDMGLNFQIYIDPRLPKKVILDSLRIRQVLTNLLSNAMKFSSIHGIVLLNIKYNDDAKSIFFSVKDTGIGIAKENQDKIFEAFSQEEDSTSRKYGGTGLGLAISAKLVSLMDSKLQLSSQTGEGSEFYFTIVVEVPEDNEIFDPIPKLSNLNIALLYDNQEKEQSSVLQEYLASFGIQNLICTNDLNDISRDRHSLLILNATNYGIQEIQSFLNKGYAVIVIKSSLSQKLGNVLKGKVSIIDPPFTPSSLYDSLIELFMVKASSERTTLSKTRNFQSDAHILIAEDNDANQYLMTVIMKKLNLKFSFASDGLEAIKMFKENNYDLILMDENMPNMNGTEATRNIINIEKEKNLKHTPIVSLTANAIKGDRERFLEAGMDEYLSKPIIFDNLISILKCFLPEDERSNKEDIIEVVDNVNSMDKVSKNVEPLANNNEIITIESLSIKKGYDPEDIEVLLGMFLDSIDDKMKELINAVNNKDYQLVFSTSHTIKGSSGNIGLDNIFEASLLIETNARANNEYDYKSQIMILQSCIQDAKKIKGQEDE